MRAKAPLDERVMRRLKLRELRILTAVAQVGTMGKAAAQLALSQPAVSKAIAEMEHTLGFCSSIATPHGVEPTLLWPRPARSGRLQSSTICARGCGRFELADPGAGEVRVWKPRGDERGAAPSHHR